MNPLRTHNYYVYILTNQKKTVLYIGVTNGLKRRLYEHKQDSEGKKNTFAGKYNTIYLVYYERFQYIEHAIKREKQLKGWKRDKKDKLITDFNPIWNFLNKDIE